MKKLHFFVNLNMCCDMLILYVFFMLQKMPDRMSKYVSEKMSDNMSEY